MAERAALAAAQARVNELGEQLAGAERAASTDLAAARNALAASKNEIEELRRTLAGAEEAHLRVMEAAADRHRGAEESLRRQMDELSGMVAEV